MLRKLVPICAALPGLLLGACGGGAGQGPGDTPPPETYLFYAGSLVAVDPANAGQVTVEAGATTGAAGVLHGRYDPAAKRVGDLHQRSIVYAHGGRLYKVNAVKGGGTPTPTQVSSESGANTICETRTFANFADHDNAFYFYRLPGNDATCDSADDVLKAAHLGMGAADAPIGVGAFKVLAPVLDIGNGALGGWLFLANSGTALWHSNLNVSGSTLVDAGSGALSDAEFFAYAADGRLFLRVVQTGFDRLRLYNPATRLLSSGYHSFATAGSARVAVDDQNLVLQDGATLHKLPRDGSAASTPFHDAGVNAIVGLASTPDRVAWVTRDPGKVYRLNTLPKTGTALVSLLETSAANQDIRIVGTVGERIYYNLGLIAGDNAAGTVFANGTGKLVQADAAWTAIVNGTRADLGEAVRLGRFASAPSHVLRTGIGAPRRLAVYDAASYSVLSESTLPDGTGFLGAGLASAGAVLGESGIGSGSDVFYLELARNDSLIQLTDTPGTHERVVGGCVLAGGSDGGADPMLPVLGLIAAAALLRQPGSKRRKGMGRI